MKKNILILTWVFSLLLCGRSFSQTVTVKGKVMEGNEPVPGASVRVKNTNIGTSTDADGEFSVNAPANGVLVITSLGYITREIPVNNKTFITVNLQTNQKELDEVVVVGYGEQKKLTLTGAISTVSGADLVKAPVAGISNALIGMAAGISAVQKSGEFGSDKATIYIRGRATLNSGGREPLIMIDGVARDTYNNLDPNEIESISILKDASATAVYGVQGANGVILITTKQGKPGKPQVNVTTNAAAIQPTILPKYLGSYDYAVLRNEAEVNGGKTPTFTQEDLDLYKSGADPIFHPSNDLINDLIKPFSFQQQYNTNISGGTDKMRYYTSLGYFNQSGGYKKPEQSLGFPFKQNYDKYNVRMNFDFNVNKDLTVSLKLGNQITNNYIPNGGAWGAFDKAANRPPMTSPLFVDGKYIEKVIGLPGANSNLPNFNPWGDAGPTSTVGAFITEDYSSTLNTNLSVNYKLDKVTPGLSVRAMGAYDSYYLKHKVRTSNFPKWTVVKDANAPEGYRLYQSSDDGPFTSLSEGIGDANKVRKVYTEAAIDYKRSFNSTHNVSGLILGNFSREVAPAMLYKLPHVYLGIVSRVTYDYKNRYMTEVNMGYNGSEQFPEGKRFGFFPSFSLGWIPTNEPFFPKNDYVSFIKFRGSYGVVGNDQIGGQRYLYLDPPYTLSNGGNQAVTFGNPGVDFARYNMYKEGAIGNHDVTWERSKKLDIGAEIKFFNDRLSFTGDYFREKRDNILWNLSTVPELVAAALPPANIGKVNNHGFELELGWDGKVNQVQYWVKGSYSFARNKIIFQDEASRKYEYLLRTGRSLGQYFGLTYEGFYNTIDEINAGPQSKWATGGLQPGDMKYKDLDNSGIIDDDDMGPVGYSDWPEIAYTMQGGFSWKGFDLSVLFQGTAHVSVSFSSAAAYPFVSSWGSAQEWHLERWSQERYDNGEKIDFPRVELSPDQGHNYKPSSFWIQDASYIRLKNLELGYRFTAKSLKRIGLNSMRVYVSGNNLITWDHLKYSKDPDAREAWGRVYPTMRVFNGGVNFQF
ncbi:TonB-dependent receptor [Pedobacter sp. BS3]|uniref:SusC/RagA family TonB-linked outer membrane protein n=1 Tax=Pedobacter sp. BS3 TaxID=2567937 RepID=UPI0011EF6A22|nr:TonB-dependent receptor [Pedobacter sp. BS3]TZF83222.1 TonB-dependent receptor [Pedobacter sp. BS3]